MMLTRRARVVAVLGLLGLVWLLGVSGGASDRLRPSSRLTRQGPQPFALVEEP